MKLIDILDLIPEDAEFCVELYNNNNEMVYAYCIGPKSGNRSELTREHGDEVIGIYAGIVRSVSYGEFPVLSIVVRTVS